ncbi:ACETYL-COA-BENZYLALCOHOL ACETYLTRANSFERASE-LIKE [Salix koriyanagi]|uniref:ACETYL-COA-BENZYLALCOHOL ACETYLTRANSFERASE-LIKE n=1 Tax=Salix koriyanagi TaxID=2511006 RepID=A0A9Q0X3G2_9ROSI|nr:ACETYL-COA-BENZYLALCOHOL ACETYLTRANSFERASE-LIKE [Salix koriyanagi]
MDVQILSQKFIKPCSQTPLHLRNMKVSFIDQLAPPAYTPMILYYAAVNGEKTESERDNGLNRLEKSLSEALACYYPLAGRYIEDRNMVDCNDEGALFLEAKVSGQLGQLDLQGEGDARSLNRFVPFGDEMAFNPIVLAVQINKFDCGGLVIGVCVSHRVADGHTMGAFLKAWATACRAGMHEVIRPSFDAGALFPAADELRFGTPVPRDHGSQIVTKRRQTPSFAGGGGDGTVMESSDRRSSGKTRKTKTFSANPSIKSKGESGSSDYREFFWKPLQDGRCSIQSQGE